MSEMMNKEHTKNYKNKDLTRNKMTTLFKLW